MSEYRLKRKCFFSSFLRNESVDRSSFRSVDSLFHERGAATEIPRHVRGMTRLPHDEAHRADHAGKSATGVSKSEMYSGVCSRSDLWTSKHGHTRKMSTYISNFWQDTRWLDLSINVNKSSGIRVGPRHNRVRCNLTSLDGREIMWVEKSDIWVFIYSHIK